MTAAESAWYPSGLLTGKTAQPYAVVVLNQPINRNALDALLGAASLLVCADAGGDRLLQYQAQTESRWRARLPDAVVGDLDSLSKRARRHYSNQGVPIIEDPDQYATDFTKCLKWTRKHWNTTKGENAKLDIVVLGGLGGRVDQGFSQIHHLLLAEQDKALMHGRIYLLSEQSLTFVLDDGSNVIYVAPDTFAENVGIIPILGLAHISTRGLEWDVEDWPTQFGGQMSTSNHLKSDKISIEVKDARVLFTLELAAHFCL